MIKLTLREILAISRKFDSEFLNYWFLKSNMTKDYKEFDKECILILLKDSTYEIFRDGQSIGTCELKSARAV